MENFGEMLRSIDITYVYVIAGVVVVLVAFLLIWILFLRKKMGPPSEEIKNAEWALSEAKQQEADLYAPDEYKRAEDSLASASHLLAAKEYPKATKVLQEAAGQARHANTLVAGNKSKMKAEVERMLSDYNRQVDELKFKSAKPEMDIPATVSSEIQELVGRWEIMKMRIPDLIQRGSIKAAYDELKMIEVVFNNAQRHELIEQPGTDKRSV